MFGVIPADVFDRWNKNLSFSDGTVADWKETVTEATSVKAVQDDSTIRRSYCLPPVRYSNSSQRMLPPSNNESVKIISSPIQILSNAPNDLSLMDESPTVGNVHGNEDVIISDHNCGDALNDKFSSENVQHIQCGKKKKKRKK